MRIGRQRWMAVAVACGLLTFVLAPGTVWARGKSNTCKPGVDKNFSWKRIGINQARKAGKPILLYVYDPQGGKASTPVKKMQKEVFANEGVKSAFSSFIMVMQPHTATNWPPHYVWPAKNGAALYIMTSDGIPVMTFTHSNMPKAVKVKGKSQYQVLMAAADAAVKANPKVVEAMKKNPPKEYLSPRQIAERRAAKAQPEEQPPEEKKPDAASLLDGGTTKDKKKDPPRKKKRIIPEDEEE